MTDALLQSVQTRHHHSFPAKRCSWVWRSPSVVSGSSWCSTTLHFPALFIGVLHLGPEVLPATATLKLPYHARCSLRDLGGGAWFPPLSWCQGLVSHQRPLLDEDPGVPFPFTLFCLVWFICILFLDLRPTFQHYLLESSLQVLRTVATMRPALKTRSLLPLAPTVHPCIATQFQVTGVKLIVDETTNCCPSPPVFALSPLLFLLPLCCCCSGLPYSVSWLDLHDFASTGPDICHRR